jgi:hypothetical protein
MQAMRCVTGQGNALRTDMRGALIVRRRRKSRNRTEVNPQKNKNRPSDARAAFFAYPVKD